MTSSAHPRHGLLLGLLLALILLWPSIAHANRPIISPGREAAIEDLFAPHELGSELSPGWTLHSFAVDHATIVIWLQGPEETWAKVTLDHPDYGPEDARRTRSFALGVDLGEPNAPPPEGATEAVRVLTSHIAANDDGQFWVGERTEESREVERTAVYDGLVVFALFLVLLGALVVHKLGDAEVWQRWVLLGVFALGVALRLLISVRTTMAPWTYTRVLIAARLAYHSPSLAVLHPGPVWLTDVIHMSTLLLSFLAPLAVYVHARYLLADRRAALGAAALVAVLPLHLRFSHSDAAFIASITVSSVTFALVHAATREEHRVWRWVALLVLPFPVALTFVVRPLNIMYFPLLLATAFVNEGLREDKEPPTWGRIGLVALIVTTVTLSVGVPYLLSNYEAQVHGGLSLDTLRSAVKVLFSFEMNALINPRFTPPGVALLALYGTFALYRRGRVRLATFLVLWLGGFLAAHAYVVPREPMMQARYHLHLIVPFMLLAVAGFESLLDHATEERLGAGRRRALIVGIVAYVGLSPLIHLRFIRDVAFDEMREWTFVHELRDVIPEGCVVLEHTGLGMDSRMSRVGANIVERVPRSRYQVVPLQKDDLGVELSEEALAVLRDPPACLYFLQALPCTAAKPDAERLAPACHAVPGWLPHEEVARAEFESRVYDGNYGVHLGAVHRIELVLYRLDAPPSGPAE